MAAAHEQTLRKALMKLMPLQCKNKQLWLPSDSAMVISIVTFQFSVFVVKYPHTPRRTQHNLFSSTGTSGTTTGERCSTCTRSTKPRRVLSCIPEVIYFCDLWRLSRLRKRLLCSPSMAAIVYGVV